MGCLDDAALYELIHGRLAAGSMAAVDAHLDRCDACRDLVVAAARGSDGRDAPAADELRAGDAVDRYLVLGRVGGGAMGVVYAAHDAELDRKVALKLLRPELDGSPARVLREAQAMARLQHPNVVTVHDVGTAGDRVFVAMELIAGPTLRVWAAGQPGRARLLCLVAAGRGLAAAHAAGVIHRDVKPDNIIVDEHGRPRIGDFGLARAADADEPRAVVGTPRYMAPEQERGEAATPASDQYSFAVTAWEILFGARPFAIAARGGVPVAVERALRRALAPAPADRFPSVSALLDAIEPRAPRRWLYAAVAAGVAAAAAVAVIATRPPARALDPCRDVGAALDAVWSPAVERDLRAKLVVAHDRTSADRLAAWTSAWRGARVAVCHAGRVRGAESEALLDVRTACLERGRAELAALLGELQASPAAQLTGVAAALGALTDPSECAGSAALALLAPVPAAQRAAVADVERRVAAVRARFASSAPIDPADGAALVTAAAATAHAPTLAAAHLVHADLLRRAGDAAAADTAARAAVVAAEIGHDDLGAARAWITRVGAAGERRDLGAADEWLVLAGAAVARAGEPPVLAAALAHDVGMLAMNRGELARADAELRRALALRTELAAGRPDLDVARTVSALGHVARLRGELDEALQHFVASAAASSAVLDESHPEVARELHNQAGALRLLGKLDEADARYHQALALRLRALGPAHPDVGLSHNSLGLLAIERGELGAAVTELEQARAILAAAGHGDLPIALANLGLAHLRRGAPRDARPLLADAIARYRATLPPRHERLARALLDAATAALQLRDAPQARALLAEARAAIPAEGGERFVREADDLAARLRPSRPAASPPPPPKPQLRPPVLTPRNPGTYGSGQSWN